MARSGGRHLTADSPKIRHLVVTVLRVVSALHGGVTALTEEGGVSDEECCRGGGDDVTMRRTQVRHGDCFGPGFHGHFMAQIGRIFLRILKEMSILSNVGNLCRTYAAQNVLSAQK